MSGQQILAGVNWYAVSAIIAGLSFIVALAALFRSQLIANASREVSNEALVISKHALQVSAASEHYKARANAAERLLTAMDALKGAAEDIKNHYWRPRYPDAVTMNYAPIDHAYRTALLAEHKEKEDSLTAASITAHLVLSDLQLHICKFEEFYRGIWSAVLKFTGEGPDLDDRINQYIVQMAAIYSETREILRPVIRRDEQLRMAP